MCLIKREMRIFYLGNSDDLGCTDTSACNYNPNSTIDDGTCGVLDDCGVCHTPCCFNLSTQICDYSVSEQDCQNFWADYSIVSDPNQNIFWNTSCLSGCTDPVACNYDATILPGGFDDGSCVYPEAYYDCFGECLNDVDNDGICDELECAAVLCEDGYECILGDCICINDINANGICDEDEQQDCSNLEITSIYQSGPSQFIVNVTNNSWDDVFSYPGFVLFNAFGDTLAIENVNYYALVNESTHYLEILDDVILTEDVSLELFTDFYDFIQCQWDDLVIIQNCDLLPEVGPCDAAIPIYYFNQENNQCEEFLWGGCNGIVPFMTLEDCQNSCANVNLHSISLTHEIVAIVDLLGRKISNQTFGHVIVIYKSGRVEKQFISSQ